MKKQLVVVFLTVFATLFSQKQSFTTHNLNINTEYSDFGATYYKDGQIVFSTPKTSRMIKRIWTRNNQPYLDFFVTKKSSGSFNFEEPTSFSDELNTRYHEGTLAFTQDFSTVYFTRDNYINGKLGKEGLEGKVNLKIYKANIVDGKWTNIKELPINSDKFSTGHPTLSKDDKKLYFASDREGGYGSTDIYVVDIIGNDQYSEPKNLGTSINSSAKDEFPYIDENGTLYFSSNREGGNGGLDIYYAFASNGEFTKSQNIGNSLNTVFDDFSFIKEVGADRGYFSSNREGGKGDDDIYSFNGELPEKCEREVEIAVVNEKDNAPIPGIDVQVIDEQGRVVSKQKTTSNGLVKFNGDCNKSYKAVATKDNLEPITKDITTSKNNVSLGLNILDKETKDQQEQVKQVEVSTKKDISTNNLSYDNLAFNIQNVLYDTNKSNIRFSERAKLDKLVNIMIKNPKFRVKISSYTDCRGTYNYNMKLSVKRANKAKDYLISKGINASRIDSKGYGETNPVNSCDCSYKCSDKQYQENRRTEFSIIN